MTESGERYIGRGTISRGTIGRGTIGRGVVKISTIMDLPSTKRADHDVNFMIDAGGGRE